jgi:phosphatidylglycerophosphate synthase
VRLRVAFLKIVLVVGLFILGVADAVPTWVLWPVGALTAIQLGCILLYAIRRSKPPMTLLEPLVLPAVLVNVLPLPSPMVRLLAGITAILLALNDAYYFMIPLWYRNIQAAVNVWTRLTTHTAIFGAYGERVIQNYQLKLERPKGSDLLITVPNIITLVRMAAIPPGLFFLYHRHFIEALLIGMLFIALDIADGYIARASGQVTVIGKILDVSADKSAMIGLGIVLLWIGELPGWLFAVAIARIAIGIMLSLYLFSRNLPLPRADWTFPSDASVMLCALVPNQWSSFITIALNVQCAINVAHQAAVIARQR